MCDHVWREVHEEFLLGGSFKTGYKCERCGKWVGVHELTPEGLGGVMSSKVELHGPLGATSRTGSGGTYTRQIYDRRTGKLRIDP